MWLSVSALGDEPQCWLEALARALPDEYERAWFPAVVWLLPDRAHERAQIPVPARAGRGGKSTIVDILRTVAGGYHVGIPDNAFTGGRDAPNREWLARLRGGRLVTLADIPGSVWSRLGLFKSLVAGDSVTARHLYAGSEDWIPPSSSSSPGIRSLLSHRADDGFARRLVLVPLEKIPIGERDLTFPERLHEELDGIAGWMVAGAVDWFDQGLGPIPQRWAAASRQYLAAEDVFRAWFDACLEADPASFIQSRDLVASFNGLRRRGYASCDPLAGVVQRARDARDRARAAPNSRRSNPRDGISGVRCALVRLAVP